MATKAKSPEPDAPPEDPGTPEEPELSEARQAFNRGEITWRELVEAEG